MLALALNPSKAKNSTLPCPRSSEAIPTQPCRHHQLFPPCTHHTSLSDRQMLCTDCSISPPPAKLQFCTDKDVSMSANMN